MFERLAHLVVRRRRATLALFVLGLVVAGVLGSGVFSRLQASGYTDPASDSARAAQQMHDQFGVADPVAALAVVTRDGLVADAGDATALVQRLRGEPGVTQVVSWWTSGRPAALAGKDGRTAQVIVYGSPDANDVQRNELAKRITDTVGGTRGDLTVHVAGASAINNALNDTITKDLAKADSIAIPVTIVLLILVFGGLVAAGLPFVVAAGAVVGSFAALFTVTLVTDVSIFALNLVTGLGLGLGIDYALLVVNRFRERLAAGDDVENAVVHTVGTAGRTVVVSGVTVAITLASLSIFPQYFLRSFAYAGIAVTLLAVLSALVALPAVLALLGHRVNRFKVVRGDLAPRDNGVWAGVARRVMRSPWPVMAVVAGVLLLLASPALGATFGQGDDRALPKDNPAAVASQILREQFPGRDGTPVDVVLPAGVRAAGVADYAAALSKVDGIVQVTTPTSVVASGAVVSPNQQPAGWTTPDGRQRLALVADVDPRSPSGQRLVDAVRAVPAPASGVLVGGAAAEYADTHSGITDRLPAVLAWIAVTTLVVLFLFTGSVVLPIKAIALNVLSLGATLGVLVWIFQDGHLRGLIGDFGVTGTVDTSMMVLIAILAFALSMDYEVFLLSRIKEEYDRTGDTRQSVMLGLQRSGRIITAAAALLAVVFAAFVSSGVTGIKQLGIGVAFAILLDATIVRGLLVPAFMGILGDANWWAPRPLRALHARIGLPEGAGPAPVPSPAQAPDSRQPVDSRLAQLSR
ncbi:MAG: MMPL family transporter [Kineosporiaceae bacterium]